MHILYLSRWFPFPPDNGVKMRLFQLIKALAECHTVDLISFCAQPPDDAALQSMASLCRRMEIVPYRPFNPNRLKAWVGFFASKPRSLIDTFQPEMMARVAAAVKSQTYDLIIASEIDMTPYAGVLGGVPVLFEGAEISSYLDGLNQPQNRLSGLRRQATWWKLSGYLKQCAALFDGWAVVSEQERSNLMRISPALERACVIPNGADLERSPAHPVIPQPDRLIYAGSLTYQANFDAVFYFLSEIFPLILKEHPGVRFYVTGSHDNVDISRLPASPNLVLTGHLADIVTAVAESWVSVVPLRKGSGTRLKILESLSLGTPVVSTSKGFEGLDLIPGSHILVGDNPAAFAAQVNQVLENKQLRSQLSRQGRHQVQQKYDWTRIGTAFREFAEQVSRQPARLGGYQNSLHIQVDPSNKAANGKHV
jgi:glycosyltransferase involved in cell wall biosynthesis